MRPTTKRSAICGVFCLLLAGCDGGMGGAGPGPGPQQDTGLPTFGDGYAPKTCSPPCVAPKVCSKAGVCIDPGSCAHDGDCASTEVCDTVSKTCVPADKCGAKEITADAVPPNLLVVLDRSCSMKALVGTKSKWEIAVDALSKLLSHNQGKIRFGLTLFPDTTGGNCKQDQIPFPVAAGNEAKITSTLTAALTKADANYPDGPCVTNIDTAMEQAATEPAFKDTGRESFALLITDGKQAGCSAAGGDAGTTQIIKDLLAKKVPTFVVGFGSGVDPSQLNIFAEAGGKPTGDPTTKFYKAEDQQSLDAALSKIAAQTLGCVYKLGQVPPTLDKIYVYFDNIEIPQDTTHQSGWDYDPGSNTVTFYGASCQALEAGQVKDLDIVYGCKKQVPDPEPPGGDGGAPPACKPGEQVCTMSEQCPPDHSCVAGCCTKTVD